MVIDTYHRFLVFRRIARSRPCAYKVQIPMHRVLHPLARLLARLNRRKIMQCVRSIELNNPELAIVARVLWCHVVRRIRTGTSSSGHVGIILCDLGASSSIPNIRSGCLWDWCLTWWWPHHAVNNWYRWRMWMPINEFVR